MRLLYVAILLLPLAGIGVLSHHDLGRWLSTGLCPAGPMDRPSRACGLPELFFIVFLGGWASFLVVPLLLFWGSGVTFVFWLATRRRAPP